jgi:hypothetical protein
VRRGSVGEVSVVAGGVEKGGGAAAIPMVERRRGWTVRRRGAGATAVPPQAANPGAARGGLATDKQAPHVCTFHFLEILENSFHTRKIDTR